MNDKVLPLCAALAAVLMFPSNAYCQDGKQAVGQSEKNKEFNRKSYLKNTALIPVKLLAVGSAVVVGTPIAVVRHEAARLDEYSEAVGDELNSKDGNLLLVGASIPGQILRSVGTAGEGILDGSYNAIHHGMQEPFSDQSFSLENLEFLD